MSTIGATGPGATEDFAAAAAAELTDQTDLEIQESRRQAELRAAQLGVPPKKTNGAGLVLPVRSAAGPTGNTGPMWTGGVHGGGDGRHPIEMAVQDSGGVSGPTRKNAPTGAAGTARNTGVQGGSGSTGPTGTQPGPTGTQARLSLDFLDDFFGADKRHLVAIKKRRVRSLISRPAISTQLTAPDSKNSSLIAAMPASTFISAPTRLRERCTKKPPRTMWSRHATFGSTLTRGRASHLRPSALRCSHYSRPICLKGYRDRTA